jgi:aldose sugar dehydrogenase
MRATLLPSALLAAFVCALGAPAGAQTTRTEEHVVRAVTVVAGLDHPWSVAFLADGRMLITERPGRLRIVGKDGKLDPRPVEGLPANVVEHGQGGLLDVALHPKFAENAWVYLSYAARDGTGVGTEVARGKLAGNRLTELQTLFRMQPKSGGGRHFGSRLVFDRDGYLLITLGDRCARARSRRSGRSATATCRAPLCTRAPARCGRTSTGRRAGTR